MREFLETFCPTVCFRIDGLFSSRHQVNQKRGETRDNRTDHRVAGMGRTQRKLCTRRRNALGHFPPRQGGPHQASRTKQKTKGVVWEYTELRAQRDPRINQECSGVGMNNDSPQYRCSCGRCHACLIGGCEICWLGVPEACAKAVARDEWSGVGRNRNLVSCDAP